MEHKDNGLCCPQHEKQIAEAMAAMPCEKDIEALSSFFKMIGDPTRIKMMYVMAKGEVCVQDIASVLGMTKSAISHQLSGLRDNSLVKSRREGKNVFYSIDDEHVETVISMAMTHIRHDHSCDEDHSAHADHGCGKIHG